jgi:hypothetical protein
LAETYLNLANAQAFLGDFQKAVSHSEQACLQATHHCQRLQHTMDQPGLSEQDKEVLND